MIEKITLHQLFMGICGRPASHSDRRVNSSMKVDPGSGHYQWGHLVAAVGYDPLLGKQSIPRASISSALYDIAIRLRIQIDS